MKLTLEVDTDKMTLDTIEKELMRIMIDLENMITIVDKKVCEILEETPDEWDMYRQLRELAVVISQRVRDRKEQLERIKEETQP